MSKRKKITVSVISELATDQRVIRICTTLQAMGFDVFVLARKFTDSLPLENYSFRTNLIRCFFRRGPLQYAEFMTKLFFRLLFTRTDYYLANDLDCLLPNYLLSRLKRKHLFYDTHEYFTGVPELAAAPFKRKAWKRLEDWIVPKLESVYTVNQSVKQAYEQEYPVDMKVIRNVPARAHVTPAPIPYRWENKIILLAQGTGFNTGRSCIEMIDAMPLLDDRFHLVFIGGGNAWESLKTRRSELHLENRIDMMEKMLPSRLKSYTLLAHLGISLDSFDDKNLLFNLPNKVFDYLQAGVPLFATAIPEIKKIVDEYQCGICIYDTSAGNISRAISQIFDDPLRYESLKTQAIRASHDLCWEKEEEKLKEIYRPFLA